MPKTPSAPRPPSPPLLNLLLAKLPTIDRQRLLPSLTVISLVLKEVLHKPGEPIRHVYFPGGGFLSTVTVLKNGRMVEVATVGREGMAGGAAVMADLRVVPATIVQGAADVCYRMTGEAFREEFERRGAFSALVNSYAQAMVGGIMQSAACNAVHSVEQRLARWLLMAHDRMVNDQFPLTQEFAAMMLGTSRQTVTIVAGHLQNAGLITYHRGIVTIVKRGRLESASCECYAATTALFNAVLDGATSGSLDPLHPLQTS